MHEPSRHEALDVVSVAQHKDMIAEQYKHDSSGHWHDPLTA